MLLKEAVTRYMAEVLMPRRPKHTTLVKTKSELLLLVRAFGANILIADISTRRVANWRSEMLQRGLSGATVNRRQNDLRAILRKVRRWGYETQDIAWDMVKLPPPEERYLTDAEYKRLLLACPYDLERLVIFLAGTGARRSEALELDWTAVDLAAGTVRFVRTKGGKPRIVPLPEQVRSVLETMETKEGRVFSIHPRRAWDTARRRAELEWLRLHDLRHYYASSLVRRGVPLYAVQKLLGHASPVLTQRYASLRPDDLTEWVQLLEQAL